MFGAIAGDIIGSVYEHYPIKTTRFPLFSSNSRFTDDTVLTIAVANAILLNHDPAGSVDPIGSAGSVDYASALKNFARKYPNAGYGMSFYTWMLSDVSKPYNSWGNGSAMRVSAVGFGFDSLDDVLEQAKKSAAVTHNHPEGIKGAQATAMAILLARKGSTKQQIQREISNRFGYELNRKLEEIRPAYSFDVSCQGTVPEAIIAFLESEDVEGAIRGAVSLGGDSDTLACIAGGIAQAFYRKIPAAIVQEVRRRLPAEFLTILDEFNAQFNIAL